MPLPKALGMYADVKQVFDTCLAQGALTLTFQTPAKASQFRQRGYYYRKLLHTKQLEALGLEVANTYTPYDSIKLTISKTDPLRVRVEEVHLDAVMVLDSGETPQPPEPETPVDLSDDSLEALARKFAQDLEG